MICWVWFTKFQFYTSKRISFLVLTYFSDKYIFPVIHIYVQSVRCDKDQDTSTHMPKSLAILYVFKKIPVITKTRKTRRR